MLLSVNVSAPLSEVPMIRIFEGGVGNPFASSAHSATRTVAFGGSDPPVELCEMVPTTGPPAPGENVVTGSLPVITRLARTLGSASESYTWFESKVHSPGNRASQDAAWTWYGAQAGPSGIGYDIGGSGAGTTSIGFGPTSRSYIESVTVCPSRCTDQSFFNVH